MALVRLRSPGAERRQWSERIRRALEIYAAVRRRHARTSAAVDRFVMANLQKQQVHMRPTNQYFKLFKSIIQTLEAIRTPLHNNPWERLVEDYIEAVVRFWLRRGHFPFLTQLAPNEFNLSLFTEWIAAYEAEYDEPYFKVNCLSVEAARQHAVDSLRAAAKAHRQLLDTRAADLAFIPEAEELAPRHSGGRPA